MTSGQVVPASMLRLDVDVDADVVDDDDVQKDAMLWVTSSPLATAVFCACRNLTMAFL